MRISDKKEAIKYWALLVLCLGLYITQFKYILEYATNVPYWDEWEALTETGFLANPTLLQFFAQHNEHRIVTTKLLTFLLYYMDGWNLITQQAVNFVIYGILLCILVYVVKKCVPQMPKWLLFCFIIFPLSTVAWENHFWGFQSQFHFALLFLLLSVFFLFDREQPWKKLYLGIIFSWLTIYSQSSGLVEIIVVMICYVIFKIARILHNNDRQSEIQQIFLVVFTVGGAIGLYFIGYVRPAQPELTLPYQNEFWVYFFNLFSNGFGITAVSIFPGIALLIFVLFPVFGEAIKKRLFIASSHWMVLVLILAIVTATGAVAMGRAGFHSIEQSKSSRYCEIVVMLIPLSVGMWAIFLMQQRKLQQYLILAFWILCMVSFAKHWNFSRIYSENALGRQTGRQCVEAYYLKNTIAECKTIYPVSIANRLEFSKTLKVSFEEEINNSSSTK